ncbi:MAG: RnfABCDGE type electron transport complex subunit D [Gammaproteobacteria bacterium]|nr:RnfABCDGE type electron transport complex subunit D [Gammaproteobacteria bacterium]
MNTVAALFDLRTRSTSRIMTIVALALLPGGMTMVVFFGVGVLINVLAAILFACALEAVALLSRKHTVVPTLKDGSMVLAAALLALSLPPLLPLWQLALGVLAMVFLGKHLFGGLGQNPFNPAMVGYAVLLISFPNTMIVWPELAISNGVELSATLSVKISGNLAEWSAVSRWDAITRPTPLDRVLANTTEVSTLFSLPTITTWVWINVAFLVGGLALLSLRIIRWHIPISVLLTFSLCLLLDATFSHSLERPLLSSLFSGALMIGAFFIATDPVTAAASPLGRLIFGSGIGILIYILREFSAYPEGVAFAVLLMNLCVPAIDALTLRTGRLQ